ncbi:hypothetical protein KAR48_08110 [bacterium]|nr:hypothetical protein [bacterium]
MTDHDDIQLGFLATQAENAVVHYFDRNGALHSHRLIRRIKKGKKKGQVVVEDNNGRHVVPFKVRNIEFLDGKM